MHSKEVLEEFIYRLNEANGFRNGVRKLWSDCVYGFSFDGSLPGRFIRELDKADFISEGIDAVICVLGDWESVPEGIIFTDRAIYVNSPKNKQKRFHIHYEDIAALDYNGSEPELQIKKGGYWYTIDTPLWSKRNIHDFLQFAVGTYEFDGANDEVIRSIRLDQASGAQVGAIASGIIYGDVSNASTLYFDDKLATPRGHGFAAERANHLIDRFSGKKAAIVGDDNGKDGADRVVNGVQIQSKYCSSGSKCVQECFRDGKFRYYNPDGTPMQIEVPSDMYDAAVQAMEERIRREEVPGVTDPAKAREIIRQGHITYAQAKNIAKAGTVESITYDAASGAIIAANAFGITAVLSFACAVWNGEDIDVALQTAALQGLKVGGTSFVTAVLAGQLSKAGLNSLLVSSSEKLVSLIGPKASAVLVNAFRSGTNIYGAAAMKSAAKMLRGNVITGAVSFVVLSAGDVANIFRGRISGTQLFKNVTNTAASIAGGGAGWTAGSAAGASAGAMIGSVVPGIGTAIGGTVGSIVGGLAGAFGGGAAAAKVTGAVMDQFIEDDAEKMVGIIQDVFTELAQEYLATQQEAERVADRLQSRLTGKMLKDMFASGDRRAFARELIEDDFRHTAEDRPCITLPTASQMAGGLRRALEALADSDPALAQV